MFVCFFLYWDCAIIICTFIGLLINWFQHDFGESSNFFISSSDLIFPLSVDSNLLTIHIYWTVLWRFACVLFLSFNSFELSSMMHKLITWLIFHAKWFYYVLNNDLYYGKKLQHLGGVRWCRRFFLLSSIFTDTFGKKKQFENEIENKMFQHLKLSCQKNPNWSRIPYYFSSHTQYSLCIIKMPSAKYLFK